MAVVILVAAQIGDLWEGRRGVRSFNVGIAVAYVFVDLFPHLAYWQHSLLASPDPYRNDIGHLIFTIALVGFVFNLGLVLGSGRGREHEGKKPLIGLGDHSGFTTASLAVYCFMVGYITTTRKMVSPLELALFTMAMCVHFAGLASLLEEQSSRVYASVTRYVLAASVIVGSVVGIIIDITLMYRALLYAFVSGTVVVVAAAYELPRLRSRNEFPLFAAGAASFAVIMFLVESH